MPDPADTSMPGNRRLFFAALSFQGSSFFSVRPGQGLVILHTSRQDWTQEVSNACSSLRKITSKKGTLEAGIEVVDG